MFDGSYKRKRRVNLGGKTQNKDRDNVVDQARILREDRALQKLKQLSAAKIQSAYRGQCALGEFRSQLAASWETKFLSHTRALVSGQLTREQVLSFVREGLFITQYQADAAKITKLCILVMGSCASQHTGANIALPGTESSNHEWGVWTRRLFERLAQYIAIPLLDASAKNNFPLQVIQTLSNADTAAKLLQQNGHSMDPDQRSAYQTNISNVFRYLAQNTDFYPRVRAFIVQAQPTNPDHITWASTLVDLLIKQAEREDGASPLQVAFTAQILSIPALSTSLAPRDHPTLGHVRATVSSPALWARTGDVFAHDYTALMKRLPDAPATAGYPSSPAWLLGNLLHFLYRDSDTEISPTHAMRILPVLQGLISALPASAYADEEAIMEMEEDSDDELNSSQIMSPHAKSHAPVPMRWETTLPAPPALRAQLDLIWSPRFLQLLATTLNVYVDMKDTATEDELIDASNAIKQICQLFSNLLTSWKKLQRPLLSALAYQHGLINGLWQWLSHSVTDIERTLNKVATEREPDFAPFAVINMFCMCYGHLLITIDDTEFYETGVPFDLPTVISIIKTLKPIAYDILWNGKTGLGNLGDTCNSMTKLLMKLHVRDIRRTYCPEDVWLGSKFTSETLINNLRNLSPAETGQGRLLDVSSDGPRANLIRNDDILVHMPYLIPFMDRVRIFRKFVSEDLGMALDDRSYYHAPNVTIRRDHLYEDGFAEINKMLSTMGVAAFKDRLQINFINASGVQEAGIDGGGLLKEFMTHVTKAAFGELGLFKMSGDNEAYPNPHSRHVYANDSDHFRFLGRLVGKALYESILLDVPFAGFFLNKILGNHNMLNDLSSLDKQVYKNLLMIKHYEGDLEDLGLTFVVTDEVLGEMVETELVRDGKEKPVTKDNVIQYIYLVAHYRLNVQIGRQCREFLEGFAEMINPKWIRLFNQRELLNLISGTDTGFDVEDLRRHTVYSHYKEDDQTIQWFWEVVQEFDTDNQRALLSFVTSCERAPLLGFEYLNPKFCIHRGGDEAGRLPSASTCMNFLKLPEYHSREELRDKLVMAINSGAGFEMS